MPPELVAVTEGPDILLDKPIVLLGRHHECDVQLNSRKVSRRHCCIAQVQDYLVVRDLASTNGIRINGERVGDGRLSPGDELMIGNFVYRIRWLGHPAQALHDEDASGDKPALPARFDDPGAGSEMDSVEEPVALDSILGVPRKPKPSRPSANGPASHGEKKSPMEDQPPSLILPDHLELAPSSIEFPKERGK